MRKKKIIKRPAEVKVNYKNAIAAVENVGKTRHKASIKIKK